MLLRDRRVDPASKLNYAIRGAVDTGHEDVVRLLLADSRVDPTGLSNFCVRTAAEKARSLALLLLLFVLCFILSASLGLFGDCEIAAGGCASGP